MDSFNKWFTRFMFATEIIFLVASMPHIAAWFAHFDNPTDMWTSIYAWGIGFALAFAIDGVAFMVLLALTKILKHSKVNAWVVLGLIVFMVFIAGLSWFINVQYDVQFASIAFAKADAIPLFGTTIGTLNPIIGGAFQLLILAYALIGKAIGGDDNPVMSDEQFEAEKKRIAREQELKQLRGSNKNEQGLFARGKELAIGRTQSADELLQKTLTFLYDVRELLEKNQEERAIQALSLHLSIKPRTVLPLLIQARAIILRQDQEEIAQREMSEQEAPIASTSLNDEQGRDETTEDQDLLANLSGRDTVSLEDAAKVIGCQVKHVTSLRNEGKLKHGSRSNERITVASLRAYLANRKRRSSSPTTEKLPVTNGHNGHVQEMISLNEYPEILV